MAEVSHTRWSPYFLQGETRIPTFKLKAKKMISPFASTVFDIRLNPLLEVSLEFAPRPLPMVFASHSFLSRFSHHSIPFLYGSDKIRNWFCRRSAKRRGLISAVAYLCDGAAKYLLALDTINETQNNEIVPKIDKKLGATLLCFSFQTQHPLLKLPQPPVLLLHLPLQFDPFKFATTD